MSNFEHETAKVLSDTRDQVTATRRRLASCALDWLRTHPRTLVAAMAAMALIVVIAVIAGG